MRLPLELPTPVWNLVAAVHSNSSPVPSSSYPLLQRIIIITVFTVTTHPYLPTITKLLTPDPEQKRRLRVILRLKPETNPEPEALPPITCRTCFPKSGKTALCNIGARHLQELLDEIQEVQAQVQDLSRDIFMNGLVADPRLVIALQYAVDVGWVDTLVAGNPVSQIQFFESAEFGPKPYKLDVPATMRYLIRAGFVEERDDTFDPTKRIWLCKDPEIRAFINEWLV
ncbi:hypothetical protein BCR34DRAFT_647743 [Clohesyomyces aquaticus]|uniref:Uncharacterized protein n=1 Tax=Clohesyomyces aquaticus TaxID=1231657 RepID=A0A1Y1ZVJ0_9PLEO|nr:hypothetical protein BCR34DRAFT_647743 [Clohesyomyces aquaticus]